MKYKEYLKKLNLKELRIINQYWHCCPQDDGFVERHFRKKIHEYFIENNRFKDDLENKRKKCLITGEIEKYLKLKALGMNNRNKRIEKNLQILGIMYKSIIPDEIKEIVLNLLRNNSIRKIDISQCKVKVLPSLFLKLLLLLNRISKMTNNSYIAFNLIDFEYGFINNKDILLYLKENKLVAEKDEKSLIVKEENYKNWLSEKTDSIKDFYNYIFNSIDQKRCWNFLKSIYSIMRMSTELVKIEKLIEIKDIQQELSNVCKLGLITEVYKDNSKLYLLSPEMWYLLSNELPVQWLDPVIYANPDYDVFVPYNYNPFTVQIIDYFNGKEDLNYNDDYFIISSLNNYHKFDNNIFQYQELLQSIKSNCDDIPDLYEHELFKDIWD